MAFNPPSRPYLYVTQDAPEQARMHAEAVLYLGDAVVALGRLLDERLPAQVEEEIACAESEPAMGFGAPIRLRRES